MTTTSTSLTSNRVYLTLTSINNPTPSTTAEDAFVTSSIHNQEVSSPLPHMRGSDLQSRHPSLSGAPINPSNSAEVTNSPTSEQTPGNQQTTQIKQKIMDSLSVINKKNGDIKTPRNVGQDVWVVTIIASFILMLSLAVSPVIFMISPSLVILVAFTQIGAVPVFFGTIAGLCAYPRYYKFTKVMEELKGNLKSLQSHIETTSTQKALLNVILNNIMMGYSKNLNADNPDYLYKKENREELTRLINQLDL